MSDAERVSKLQAYAALATALERSLSPAFHAAHGGYLETMRVVEKIRVELLQLENQLWDIA